MLSGFATEENFEFLFLSHYIAAFILELQLLKTVCSSSTQVALNSTALTLYLQLFSLPLTSI